MIRQLQKNDIASCAETLCAVYNNEMWQCHWTMETGTAYLEDYFEAKKFVGLSLKKMEKLLVRCLPMKKFGGTTASFMMTLSSRFAILKSINNGRR